jgi:hypothetical protein
MQHAVTDRFQANISAVCMLADYLVVMVGKKKPGASKKRQREILNKRKE